MRLLISMFTLLSTLTAFAADTTSVAATDAAEKTLRMYYKFKMDSLRAVNPPYHSVLTPAQFIPFVAMLVPIIALFVGLILGKRFIEARKQERLAMIERGLDMSIFTSETESTKKYRALRGGMMYGGIGFGLLFATVLSAYGPYLYGDHFPLLILGSASLFGGLGLLAYYLIVRRLERS